MDKEIQLFVLDAVGAEAIVSRQVLQSLWSGYGEIVRLELAGGRLPSVVLKYIALPEAVVHPRGWNTDRSHQRKLRSYEVEMHWYRDWADRCTRECRVAQCYGAMSAEGTDVIVLEDLDRAGFPLRYSVLDLAGVKLCLDWLAGFHANFMGAAPASLWETGSYWHLATRPDEWAAMADGPLKEAAAEIDRRLNACRFQTVIHGDAKVANFCFGDKLSPVAAVDFQYVGAGCGMKVVAYLLGSCLSEAECDRWQDELLDHYFGRLRAGLSRLAMAIDGQALEAEWRAMYPVAWTDFYRFLLGWMPGHHKINDYTRRLAKEVLASL